MAKRLGVTFNGLDSFLQELRVMSAGLTDEANAIMLEAAEAAQRDIAAKYPVNSGSLRDGLVIRPSRGVSIAGAELLQTARHGKLYEDGTKVRTNKAGQNRGFMEATPTFRPIAASYNRQAIADINFRVLQHGATRVVIDEAT